MSFSELSPVSTSALVAEDREREVSDQVLIQWISVQVGKHGLTATAEMLDYDPANVAKVWAGKRALPARLRKRVSELVGNGIEMEIHVPPDH
jgi:hypothetical protein